MAKKAEEKEQEQRKEGDKEGKIVEETLIRILSTDIPGNKSVYAGLTRVKGISWSFSNAICNVLRINKKKKIKELTDNEIEKITEFIKNPKVPSFILNRRKDFDTGEDKHLIGSDSELRKEFDIKRLRKIKSYRGLRHATGQPVRGQRTRAHLRKNKAIGVSKGKIRKSGK